MFTQDEVFEDLKARFRPDQGAVDYAVSLLKAEPQAELAALPVYLPYKTYGIWQLGQQCLTVQGTVFIGVNSFENQGDLPSYSWCRDQASRAAARALNGEGTFGYATVRRDGTWAVFEDCLSYDEIMRSL